MSTPETSTFAEVCVEVKGIRHEGVYCVKEGVLTVWCESTAKSVSVRPGPTDHQAVMLLRDIVLHGGASPDPRD